MTYKPEVGEECIYVYSESLEYQVKITAVGLEGCIFTYIKGSEQYAKFRKFKPLKSPEDKAETKQIPQELLDEVVDTLNYHETKIILGDIPTNKEDDLQELRALLTKLRGL